MLLQLFHSFRIPHLLTTFPSYPGLIYSLSLIIGKGQWRQRERRRERGKERKREGLGEKEKKEGKEEKNAYIERKERSPRRPALCRWLQIPTSTLLPADFTPGWYTAICTAKTHFWNQTGYYCGGSCLEQWSECFSPWNLNIFIKLCCSPGLAINHSSFQASLINTKARDPAEAPNLICSVFKLL